MDGINSNINKILYDKDMRCLKDKSRLGADLELEDGGTVNLNSSLINRGNHQLAYRENLIKSLQELKNKNNFNKEDFSFKSKFTIHNASIREDIHSQNDLESSNDKIQISKTNYRSMCESENLKKVVISLPCRPINSNEFLSISRQSLNDSTSESNTSTTASRISANLMNRKSLNNSEKPNTFKSNCNLFSKAYSVKARRYRTIVKQDKFSSYLARETSEANLFSIPTGCSNVPLNLNINEDSNKRFDFSFVSKISPNLKIKESNSSNENWTCSNCNSSNPSNFNFCPTCSTSNPKLVLNNKRSMPMMEKDDNNWICSRCATKNDNVRIVCIFCFKNKNETLKRQKLDAEIRVNEAKKSILENPRPKWSCVACWTTNEVELDECTCCCAKNPCNSAEQKKEAPKLIFSSINTRQSAFDFSSNQSSSSTATASFVFEKVVNSITSGEKSENKWSCPKCWVENNPDKVECCCCSAKNPDGTAEIQIKSSNAMSTIKFGSSNTNTELGNSIFIFGQSMPSNEISIEKEKFNKTWNCSECWVENATDNGKCVCCSAKNPNETSGTKSSSTFGSTIKFGSSNTQSELGQPTFLFGSAKSITEPVNAQISTNGIVAADKKWNCPECWVENTLDNGKCVCCSAKNPNETSGTKSSSTFGSTIKFGSSNTQSELGKPTFLFGSAKSITEPVNAQISTNGILAADKSDKKWNCPECWVENTVDNSACACCSTKNPSVANHHGNLSTIFKFGQSNADSTIKLGCVDNNNIMMSFATDNKNDKSIHHQKSECLTCGLLENATTGNSCACGKTDNQIGTENETSCAAVVKETKSIFQFGSSDSVVANGIENHQNKIIAVQPTQTFQFGKLANQQPTPALSSNPSSDCLVFTFSSPKYLEVSACSTAEQEQPPIDLVFEFASPFKY